MSDESRPTKRVKIESNAAATVNSKAETTKSSVTSESGAGDVQKKASRKSSFKRQEKSQNGRNTTKAKSGRDTIRTFSQPSVLCAGDKGIFVTCDKGCEKKALLEFHDLLQGYLESRNVDASGNPTTDKDLEKDTASRDQTKPETGAPGGIEADIAAELAGLRQGDEQDKESESTVISRPAQLITLDIPCVSFIRFPVTSIIDPVEVVHKLCLEAADPETQQRSRFVKRLTPVSSLAKALSQGLEKLCEKVLPAHFAPDNDGNVKTVKFAIRPTIRENEQLNRDSIIRPVADRIQQLGRDAHKVDLKKYEKAVIVEVYRAWIGMSVVDNTNDGAYKQGYDQLKRFNLAEIYAAR